jgi:hypothetical protein
MGCKSRSISRSLGRSKERGVKMMMFPVLENNLEIGTISSWESIGVQYYQAIVQTETGIILSSTFKDIQEAQSYIRTKYKETGYIPFSVLLESAIKRADLSYRVVGASIGVSQVSVSKWVSGENYPAVHLLWRLANLLELESPESKFLEWTQVINKERK